MTNSQRHSWGDPARFQHKTERQCVKCGIVKVMRHEVDEYRLTHWTEFWRGLDEIKSDGTPVCEAVRVSEGEVV